MIEIRDDLSILIDGRKSDLLEPFYSLVGDNVADKLRKKLGYQTKQLWNLKGKIDGKSMLVVFPQPAITWQVCAGAEMFQEYFKIPILASDQGVVEILTGKQRFLPIPLDGINPKSANLFNGENRLLLVARKNSAEFSTFCK